MAKNRLVRWTSGFMCLKCGFVSLLNISRSQAHSSQSQDQLHLQQQKKKKNVSDETAALHKSNDFYLAV